MICLFGCEFQNIRVVFCKKILVYHWKNMVWFKILQEKGLKGVQISIKILFREIENRRDDSCQYSIHCISEDCCVRIKFDKDRQRIWPTLRWDSLLHVKKLVQVTAGGICGLPNKGVIGPDCEESPSRDTNLSQILSNWDVRKGREEGGTQWEPWRGGSLQGSTWRLYEFILFYRDPLFGMRMVESVHQPG